MYLVRCGALHEPEHHDPNHLVIVWTATNGSTVTSITGLRVDVMGTDFFKGKNAVLTGKI